MSVIDASFNTNNNYHTILIGPDTTSTNEDAVIITYKAMFENETELDDSVLTTLVSNLGWDS